MPNPTPNREWRRLRMPNIMCKKCNGTGQEVVRNWGPDFDSYRKKCSCCWGSGVRYIDEKPEKDKEGDQK